MIYCISSDISIHLDVHIISFRGAVNIWKPSVTPLTDLKPAELRKFGGVEDDVLIQRTSLAANKQVREPYHLVLQMLTHMANTLLLVSINIIR